MWLGLSVVIVREVWGTDYEKIKDICILAEKLGYYGFYHGAMERKPNLYKTKLKRIQN